MSILRIANLIFSWYLLPMKEKKRREAEEKAYIYIVKNPSYNDICLCAYDSVLYPGTPVVYETRFGLDLGIVTAAAPKSDRTYERGSCEICGGCQSSSVIREPELMEVPDDVDFIDHLASPEEMERYELNSQKEESALRVCREKVLKHKLNMKLVTAHFLLGESKVIFFFTAEERVDFRDLVKDLVAVFRMRIELRQIGVRDESRLIGGLSVCGRDYCCHALTSQLEPVTIKMAKEQNLSLNSMKISGPCGRLLCCLAYEYDYYVEEKASCPPEGTKLKLGRDIWKVTEVNILSRTLTVQAQEGQSAYIPLSEVEYDSSTGYWVVSEEFQEDWL